MDKISIFTEGLKCMAMEGEGMALHRPQVVLSLPIMFPFMKNI